MFRVFSKSFFHNIERILEKQTSNAKKALIPGFTFINISTEERIKILDICFPSGTDKINSRWNIGEF